MYTHDSSNYISAGTPAKQAKTALVMLHGRGGAAGDMIRLAKLFNLTDVALYAPQATNNSWYPYSFMAPEKQNQPALDSAIDAIDSLVKQAVADGIPTEKIYFVGFSQGACLTLEYVGRKAQRYGGAVAFTGGLIGQELITERYKGDFDGTPVLISTSNPDPHVPLSRVEETVKVLQKLGGDITLKVYEGKPHTITQPEIELANEVIFK